MGMIGYARNASKSMSKVKGLTLSKREDITGRLIGKIGKSVAVPEWND